MQTWPGGIPQVRCQCLGRRGDRTAAVHQSTLVPCRPKKNGDHPKSQQCLVESSSKFDSSRQHVFYWSQETSKIEAPSRGPEVSYSSIQEALPQNPQDTRSLLERLAHPRAWLQMCSSSCLIYWYTHKHVPKFDPHLQEGIGLQRVGAPSPLAWSNPGKIDVPQSFASKAVLLLSENTPNLSESFTLHHCKTRAGKHFNPLQSLEICIYNLASTEPGCPGALHQGMSSMLPKLF